MTGSSGNPEKVLVVDDDPMNLGLVDENLQAAGYEVVTATNGEEALKLFESGDFDLVMLDILMPGMDGYEVCRRMRALPAGAGTPILFLTALAEDSAVPALASGADDLLGKPFNRTELLLRTRSLLRIRRYGRELERRNQELERVNRQKEELSARVVHDLKNPLAAIIGNAGYLSSSETLSQDAKETVEDILSSSRRMQRLVTSLFEIGRGENP